MSVFHFFSNTSWVLLLAGLADYLIGDPKAWLHPTMVIGSLIDQGKIWSLAITSKKQYRRLLGVLLNLVIVIGSGLVGFWLVKLSELISPYLAIATSSVILASCFATKSLADAAQEVLSKDSSLVQMRESLAQYVGRDTIDLTKDEIYRALLETIAENTPDGVTGPLFYALLGSLIPGVGPVPLALAYKAASTLDSMIGYKREPYTYIGWFSARLEDYLTWIPSRLTVLTLALISREPRRVLKICIRDAPQDPSPNSGWSEAVYAAIVNVQLGGSNNYQGVKKYKPLLGDPLESISPAKIEYSLKLMRSCFWLWLILGIVLVEFFR